MKKLLRLTLGIMSILSCGTTFGWKITIINNANLPRFDALKVNVIGTGLIGKNTFGGGTISYHGVHQGQKRVTIEFEAGCVNRFEFKNAFRSLPGYNGQYNMGKGWCDKDLTLELTREGEKIIVRTGL